MSPGISARLLATQADGRLVALVARGHERAFEAIVLRYRRPLLAYCRRLGLADSRAEDVVQQGLLRVWQALAAGTQVRELRPWIYRIVHNAAVDAMRASSAEHAHAALASRTDPHTGEATIDQRMAARQALNDLAALPPMQREAIVMSAVAGHSHDEVAVALGVSEGAVRGLLYRARSTLRSAAALLFPPALHRWGSQSGRIAANAPTLTPLASTGTRAGGELLKGLTIVITGALATGALVPLHGVPQDAHARPPRAVHAAASVRAGEPGSPPAGRAISLADAESPAAGAGVRGAAAAARRPSRTSSGTGTAAHGVTAPVHPLVAREVTRSAAGGGSGDGEAPQSLGGHEGAAAPAGGSPAVSSSDGEAPAAVSGAKTGAPAAEAAEESPPPAAPTPAATQATPPSAGTGEVSDEAKAPAGGEAEPEGTAGRRETRRPAES